jgi:sodium-dependent dicarboxylate transporter 2/3/5
MTDKNISLSKDKIGLILGPLLFIIVFFFFKPETLSTEGRAILASSIWVATWWMTEAMPIAVTALLPIILFPLSGGMSLNETSSAYGHKYIFLYIGGFILAIAIERWNLHKRIALNIIKTIGSDQRKIILGFMLATAFLSMWISNTATAIMMLPIGMAISIRLKDKPDTIKNEHLNFGKALMIAIAYSASIGGIATLIGTAPNLVLAGIIEEIYQIEISFSQWIVVGLPISLILLICCWYYLTYIAFDFKKSTFPGGDSLIKEQLQKLGKLSKEERRVLLIFSITAISWICRPIFLAKLIPGLDDTIIAIIAAMLLFIIPNDQSDKGKLLNWEEAVKLPWGILLLFGGGLAIANGFKVSGLAEWIGLQLSALQGLNVFLLLVVLVTAINFLTEITSNLATTSMMLPILAPLGLTIGLHPFILMTACTIAASCAFMLPVATPPNAIVFGSGYLKIKDMVRTGIWMNLIAIIIISVYSYFFLPHLWKLPSIG